MTPATAAQRLHPPGGRCLERRVTRFGTIDIIERGADGARLYLQNDQVQSFAQPGGNSLVAYVQAMRSVLLQSRIQRVAVLGAAGGTLGTMLTRDGAEPILVDINPEAFELARQYFWLAPAAACVVADARRFLDDGTELFDAIVLDAFGGGDMPPHLATIDFFSLARRRLLPQGLLLVNAPVERRQRSSVPSLSRDLAASGFAVTIFEGPPWLCRNSLIVGGYVPEVALALGDEPAETRRELMSLRRRPGTPPHGA
ncbi:MAG: fused MFS/spermidine synthase [Proteobacteria bacterium]|nr:fused MFS/spermidine synthase [Pseudomonadota bacterium]